MKVLWTKEKINAFLAKPSPPAKEPKNKEELTKNSSEDTKAKT